MPTFLLFLSTILFISISLSNSTTNPSLSCPIDFSYVKTFPWETQDCHENSQQKTCCQTLKSLLGMGLSTYLKASSNFNLPTPELASSCFSLFKTELASISINISKFSSCLNSTDDLLLNHPATDCAGIRTIKDWDQIVGPTQDLNISCQGDMRVLTQCSSCLDAGMKVNSRLVSLAPNSTKCFYYTLFYAAGILNQFGPEDPRSAACILGIPLASDQVGYRQSTGKLSKNTVFKAVFGVSGALIGVFIVMGLIYTCRVWDKKRKEKGIHDSFVSSVRGQVSPNVGMIWYRVSDLERATDGFSRKNVIGQGEYGVVYKGTLNGSVVAIKQITEGLDSMRDEEFCNEVDVISKIRHRNLLSLRGCCVSSDNLRGKRRYLVCDYMPNGSLSDHLFGDLKKLTWPQRKTIILDVAKGLAYLHYGVIPAIYHHDIKASNILLDSDMRARMAEFGLGRQSIQGQSHLHTRVTGTHGYLAPEYAMYGQLTEKSDIYSFGMIILETMTGKKAFDTSNSSATPLLTDLVWDLVKLQRLETILDNSIRNEGPTGIMERFVHVGLLCAHVMVAFRPTIAQALKMLEGDIDIPKLPDRPLPLNNESISSSFWPKAAHSSSNSLLLS
ncbi:probable receptor-like protein kinase At1g11050 [Amaranthus tricolor]|uniref:probable receptor-like protein kinase At1g11050 n=1 Tax=Amaranthus tricolor TaxID=29722 RepID=UPI0025903FFA|nr:probable receptor-like protein kinase At1g11050 [Amaranthus tricolor]